MADDAQFSRPWAAHAAHNAQFAGNDAPRANNVGDNPFDSEPRSTKDILAGINPEAMRAVVEESHRGLFGDTTPPSVVPQSVPAPDRADEGGEVVLSAAKALLLKQLAGTLEETAKRIRELLGDVADVRAAYTTRDVPELEVPDSDHHVIEGVFNGFCMIGPDGKQYNVPANYASKSKLVEGDMLKLTILPSGKFLYKQIGPIERERLVGTLAIGMGSSEYYVEKDGRRWRVLHASVTYYKGQPGDEVIILIPQQGESAWAAVENIVSRS